MRTALLIVVGVLVANVAGVAAAQDSSATARAALAHRVYDARLADVQAGSGSARDVHDWSERWMSSELEAHVARATQSHLDRMTQLAAAVHAKVTGGAMPASADVECEYYVAEARVWLAHSPPAH